MAICELNKSQIVMMPARDRGATINGRLMQVQELQAQVQEQSSELIVARGSHTDSTEVVLKLESDLASLSEAYQDLQQSHDLKDKEIEALQAKTVGIKETGSGGNSNLSELLELQQEMDDLLVCLGQEEQKVAILSGKLHEMGVDADALIEHIGDEGSVGSGEQDESVWVEGREAKAGRAGVDVSSWMEHHAAVTNEVPT
jgi:predicted RNase H-like nuclease (RuvC/YqgF family)